MNALTPPAAKVVHVAVGVIETVKSSQRYILLAKRPEHVHQGGLWEFPGGKVEPGESVCEALSRELEEELGIYVDPQRESSFRPLIQIRHDYPDKSVLLDVWVVSRFDGDPSGMEGQPVRWVPVSDLHRYDFPEANKPIVTACQLPSTYLITPSYTSLGMAREEVAKLIKKKPELVLLRQPSLSPREYLVWVKALLDEFTYLENRLLLSGQAVIVNEQGEVILTPPASYLARIKGLQLPFSKARQVNEWPDRRALLLGVSCHSKEEINHAQNILADFATLSPVQETATHPKADLLGWGEFAEIVKLAKIPVYALGGMKLNDISIAHRSGAQGIAGISVWLDL